MMNWILIQASNPKFILQLVIVAATIAAVITAGAPLLNEDPLGKRMKAVALERERLRGRAARNSATVRETRTCGRRPSHS